MVRNQVQVSENKSSKDNSSENNRSFEEDLTRLEEIVAVLESGEKTLAENLKLYEEGIRLSRNCHKKLDEVEGRLQILTAVESADNTADNNDDGDQGAIEIRISDFESEERG